MSNLLKSFLLVLNLLLFLGSLVHFFTVVFRLLVNSARDISILDIAISIALVVAFFILYVIRKRYIPVAGIDYK